MEHRTAQREGALVALPLVQPHPPTRLHKRGLSRRVRSLQAVLQRSVLRVSEPVGRVCLQCCKLPYQTREVSDRVPDYVLRFL